LYENTASCNFKLYHIWRSFASKCLKTPECLSPKAKPVENWLKKRM